MQSSLRGRPAWVALRRAERRQAEATNGRNANDPIYLELMNFVAGGTTPQDVVNFRPSAEAQQRVNELIEREQESLLTPEEAAGLAHFLELSTFSGWPRQKHG